MAAFEELREQRDFLLGNQWVGKHPKESREGCLISRGDDGSWINTVRQEGVDLLEEVTGNAKEVGGAPWWNDHECKSAGEAITVLEEAMRLAKERGLTDGHSSRR